MDNEASQSSAAPAAESSPQAHAEKPAPIAQAKQDRERSARLVEKYAAKAQLAANKELGKAEVVENRDRLENGEEREASTATDPNALARAKDGKFQKKEAAAKTDASTEEKTEPTKPETATETIDRVQKLVAEGKIPEALRAIGVDPEGLNGKQWEAMRKEASRSKAQIERARAEVNQHYQKTEQWAAQLEQRYARYAQAEQALAAGDLEGFARAHGTSFDELNRKAIQQLSKQDPEVARLKADIERERQARAQVEQQQRQAAEWNGAIQRTTAALSSMGDPRVSAVLNEDPAFPAAVLTHLIQTAQRTGDQSMTLDEAVRDVLGSVSQQYAKLQKIFGGAQVPPGVGGTGASQSASREEPSRRVSPAKPRPQLSSRGAAEAHAETPLRGQALLDKYARMAAAQRATELAQIADD